MQRDKDREIGMDGAKQLQGESVVVFSEGIGLVLYHWSALRTTVENEWGGRDSRLKADHLAAHIVSWFTQSKEPLYVDDLENILDEGMLSLNVEVDDGSIEEIAENLMVMHEECLEGNFKSIEILKEANLKQAAHPHVAQVVNGDEDDDMEDDNEEGGQNNESVIQHDISSYMNLDIPKSKSNMNSVNVPFDGPQPKVAGEADDGWVVVSNRKSKGRKH